MSNETFLFKSYIRQRESLNPEFGYNKINNEHIVHVEDITEGKQKKQMPPGTFEHIYTTAPYTSDNKVILVGDFKRIINDHRDEDYHVLGQVFDRVGNKVKYIIKMPDNKINYFSNIAKVPFFYYTVSDIGKVYYARHRNLNKMAAFKEIEDLQLVPYGEQPNIHYNRMFQHSRRDERVYVVGEKIVQIEVDSVLMIGTE